MEVLAADGRIRSGEGIRLGGLGPGMSVVVPPPDPAQIGAVNRALAARGVAWHLGSLVVAAGRTDSNAFLPTREAIAQRVTLESGGSGEVLVTVDGAPWLVRSGEVLLLGSRLDPAWTALPFSAGFVPFIDAVLTRASRGEPATADLVVGEAFRIPERVNAIVHEGRRESVVAGSSWRAAASGNYLLLAGSDTVAALSARVDPRESQLTRATDGTIASLWGKVTTTDLDRGAGRAFALTGRGDLRGPLLALALCCALVETGLLGMTRSRTR
jgi:hypothetical protein